MKPDSEKRFLAAVYWIVLLLGMGFMLYSTQTTCESVLAPAHKYCAD